MYSPKIKKELIPILYELARINNIPMTALVNSIIEGYLFQIGERPNVDLQKVCERSSHEDNYCHW